MKEKIKENNVSPLLWVAMIIVMVLIVLVRLTHPTTKQPKCHGCKLPNGYWSSCFLPSECEKRGGIVTPDYLSEEYRELMLEECGLNERCLENNLEALLQAKIHNFTVKDEEVVL